MADNSTIEFNLDLNTGDMGGSAASAAEQLDRMRGAIERDETALRNMQKAMRSMQQGSAVNVKAFRDLEGRISAQKDKIAGARAAYVNLGGGFEKVRRPLKAVRQDTTSLADAAQAAGGPLGSMAGRVSGLLGAAGKAGPLLVLAAGIAAVTAASIAATGALIKYGLAQADAHRDELLRLEGLTKMRFFYGQFGYGMRLAADSASFLQEQINNVSQTVALGRSEIEGITNRLYRMGLRGGTLQTALEGVAIAQSTVGKGQADMYLQMMLGAAQTGQSIEAVADDIRARLGPLAEKQLLSWSVQSKKLRENLQQLFSSVGIENFLRPVAEITKLFSQTTITGRALKSLLERMFRPLESAMPLIAHLSKRFIQGLIIGYLSAELSVKKFAGVLLTVLGPALNWLAGQLELSDAETAIAMFERLGQVVAGVSIALIFAIGGGLTVVAAAAGSAYFALKRLVELMSGTANEVLQSQAPAWEKVGTSLVDGIINGMLGGWPRLIGALRKHAGSAIEAFKGAIGSRSPARKMYAPGASLPEGIAVGMQSRFPLLRKTVQQMGQIPQQIKISSPQPANDQTVTARRPGRLPSSPVPSVSVKIDRWIVQVPEGTSDPQEFSRKIYDEFVSMLEGVGIELGAARA